jgi:hypothetical protein
MCEAFIAGLLVYCGTNCNLSSQFWTNKGAKSLPCHAPVTRKERQASVEKVSMSIEMLMLWVTLR